jgi:hypothetical protein
MNRCTRFPVYLRGVLPPSRVALRRGKPNGAGLRVRPPL